MTLAQAAVEILNLILLTAVIGYIISGYIKHPRKTFRQQHSEKGKFFDWDDFKFSLLIAAPGIVIHELFHKFFAIGFGAGASFQIFPIGIAIGIILRLIHSPFVLLAPGYVMISQDAGITSAQMAIIAFGGPLVNLLLWLGPTFVLRNQKRKLSRNMAIFLFYTASINLWLFIFNMIPVPPLDGSKVLMGLINAFG